MTSTTVDATERQEEPLTAVEEVHGDLFAAANNDVTNVAHCVSADAHMGKGIAVQFARKFGNDEFRARVRNEARHVGEVAAVVHGKRFVYNLVTKERYWHRPTYESLRAALVDMREHARTHGVTHIAMPRIGCGLDGLQWPRVRDVLQDVFGGSSVRISVYSL